MVIKTGLDIWNRIFNPHPPLIFWYLSSIWQRVEQAKILEEEDLQKKEERRTKNEEKLKQVENEKKAEEARIEVRR